MRLLAALLLLSSCASLRTGWARVDFLAGPSDLTVCSWKHKVDADGQVELDGKCADWNDVSEGLDALGREQRLKKGWGQ